MKMFEYMGKQLFEKYGINIPKGDTIEHTRQLDSLEVAFPWVLKSQVLVGGRGKAGGIKFANNIEEAEKVVNELMGKKIKGEAVRQVLVEEKLEIDTEHYLSYILDRSCRQYLMMFSEKGGVDIESMTEGIVKIYINPLIGLQTYHLRKLPKNIGIQQKNFIVYL